MKQIETLFRNHLSLITTDREKWLSLVHDDAVIEFPYAESIGMPSRIKGRNEIDAYFRSLPGGFEKFEITGLKIYSGNSDEEVTAEFEGHIPANAGKPGYDQKYFAYLKSRDGKIAEYREYWNPIEVTKYFQGASK